MSKVRGRFSPHSQIRFPFRCNAIVQEVDKFLAAAQPIRPRGDQKRLVAALRSTDRVAMSGSDEKRTCQISACNVRPMTRNGRGPGSDDGRQHTPTGHGAMLAKRAATCPRDSFWRSTIAPRLHEPLTPKPDVSPRISSFCRPTPTYSSEPLINDSSLCHRSHLVC
jgi:hypothetical protein